MEKNQEEYSTKNRKRREKSQFMVRVICLVIANLKVCLQQGIKIDPFCGNTALFEGNQVYFRDRQKLIKLESNGLTLSGKQQTFKLEVCSTEGTETNFQNFWYIVSAWIREKPGYQLSSKSKNEEVNTEGDFFLKIAKTEWTDKVTPVSLLGQKSVFQRDSIKKSGKDQDKWIFYAWVIEKEIQNLEGGKIQRKSRIQIWRTQAESEATFLYQKWEEFEANKKETIFERCTNLDYSVRDKVHREELVLKTDICQFMGINEFWISKQSRKVLLQENQKGVQVPLLPSLMMGGRFKLLKRLNFFKYDLKILKILFGTEPRGDYFKYILHKMKPVGYKIEEKLYRSNQILQRIKEQTFKQALTSDGNEHTGGTTIILKFLLIHHQRLGNFSQTFELKTGEEETLSESLLNITFYQNISEVVNPKRKKVAKFGFEMDLFGASKITIKKIREVNNVNQESSYRTNVFLRIGFAPQTLSKASPTNNFGTSTKIAFDMSCEMILTENENHKIISTMKIDSFKYFKFKSLIYRDSSFFFKAHPLSYDENNIDLWKVNVLLQEIAFFQGGGIFERVFLGLMKEDSKFKIKNIKELDKTGEILTENEDPNCPYLSSMFSKQCALCNTTEGGDYFWLNESFLKCVPGNHNDRRYQLGGQDGCFQRFNMTSCRKCNYFNGQYFLDFFNRGRCRKTEEKCPHKQGAALLPYDLHFTPIPICLTCPLNCKECYVIEGKDFYYCKTAFPHALPSAVNTLEDVKCKVPNCGVCEMTRCDACLPGYVLNLTSDGSHKFWRICTLDKDFKNNFNAECKGEGYIPIFNRSRSLDPIACVKKNFPPFGYFEKNSVYEACLSYPNCPFCTETSPDGKSFTYQSDSKKNKQCSICLKGNSMFKSWHKINYPTGEICSEGEGQEYCEKKNLTNSCWKCLNPQGKDKDKIGLVMKDVFTLECSCKKGFFFDSIIDKKCKECPPGCNFFC